MRLDILGAILATASMTLLAYGCVHAGEHHWGNAVTISTVAGTVVAGVVFIAWELRNGVPLIRLSILRARSVWAATVIIAFIGSATIAGSYFASLFLQNVLRYSPVSNRCSVPALISADGRPSARRHDLLPGLPVTTRSPTGRPVAAPTTRASRP